MEVFTLKFTIFVLGTILIGCDGKTPSLRIAPTQPLQIKPVGQNVLLTCQPDVDNKELISELQWKDSFGRVINDRPPMRDRFSTEMMSENSLALFIHSFQETDSGNYTCTANYANSVKLSATVRLKSIWAIKWEDAPTEQYPIKDQNYRIKCKVSADPAPHVDWSKNGEAIASMPGGRYVILTDGLEIQNATDSDDGTYTCRAIVFETGELAERHIKVEVHTPPSFLAMPERAEIIEGETANIVCNATGKPMPSYSWIKKDTLENVEKRDRFDVNKRTGVMMIKTVSEFDAGEYKCVASNAAANIERYVEISVVVKPKIAQIRNVTTAVNKDVRLECVAKGRPLPHVTFRKYSSKDKMVIGPQPWDQRIVVERHENVKDGEVTAALQIRQVSRYDDGLYECIGTNKGGEAFKSGHILVEFPPVFDRSQINVTWTWERRPANLTCLAEGIPNATIKWWRNEQQLDLRYPDPSIRQIGSGPSSSLIITPNSPNLYTYYRCQASNIHGEAYHIIQLREAHVPGDMFQSKIDGVTATTLKFSLIGPRDDGGLPVRAYAVQYKERRDSWEFPRNKTWALDAPYILENLKPQLEYDFRFAAKNDVGLGQWAAPTYYVMPQRSSPAEPQILLNNLQDGIIHSPSDNKFELRWQIPADNGEPIDMYDVKYCTVTRAPQGYVETDQGCVTIMLTIGEQRGTTYVISHLISNTLYKIELRAHNIIGFSNPGQALFKTARGVDKDHLVSNGRPTNTILSSGFIIGIVVAGLFVILIVIDVGCYFFNSAGLLFLMFGSKKKAEDDSRMMSEEKELLQENGNTKVNIHAIDDRLKKDTEVSYDPKRSTVKTAFIGKDSAV